MDIDREVEKVDVEEASARNRDVGPSAFKPERIAHHIDTDGRLGVQIRKRYSSVLFYSMYSPASEIFVASCVVSFTRSAANGSLTRHWGLWRWRPAAYQKTFNIIGTFSDATLMRNEFVIKLECKADPNQNTVQIHVGQEEKLSGAESATPVLTMINLLVPGMSDPGEESPSSSREGEGQRGRESETDWCLCDWNSLACTLDSVKSCHFSENAHHIIPWGKVQMEDNEVQEVQKKYI